MVFKFYKTFESGDLADGATYSDSWTADEDYTIKRIHVMRKDGAGITKSTIYIKIGPRVFTREIAPAAVFGPDVEVTTIVDIPFTKGEKLDFTLKNLEGVTIAFFIYFEVHSA